MPKGTILLVQSAQMDGNSTRSLLEHEGYAVVWAGSGTAALHLSKTHSADLVLLDLALPDLRGDDLFRRLRRHEEMRGVPIILITSRGVTPWPITGVAERPDDQIEKPYAKDELMARVAAVFTAKAFKAEMEHKERLASRTLSHEERDAVVDPATGLFSQRQFEAMFSKEFKRAVRFKQQMSCMLIDLDGGDAGRTADEALVRAIIKLVQSTIREVDTAAWWTGRRFIILLPNTIRNDAVQAAARLLETVANHPFSWPDSTQVAMSIGVAGLPDHTIDSEQKLIGAADMACRRARELMKPLLRAEPAAESGTPQQDTSASPAPSDYIPQEWQPPVPKRTS